MSRGIWKCYAAIERGCVGWNFEFFETHSKLVTDSNSTAQQLDSTHRFDIFKHSSSSPATTNIMAQHSLISWGVREWRTWERNWRNENEHSAVEKKKSPNFSIAYIFFAIWFVVYLITEQKSSRFLHSFYALLAVESGMSLISIPIGYFRNVHVLCGIEMSHQSHNDSVDCVRWLNSMHARDTGLDCENVKMERAEKKLSKRWWWWS